MGDKALTAVQRPIVTLIVERSETPVGFRTAGPNNRLIIVEGMGDMVLRSGKRIVCLKLRRADSDGLENTVYAKTNEWDLQSAHASKPENGLETGQYEDVYGNGGASRPTMGNNSTSGNNSASGNSGTSGTGAAFFENNSFSGTQNATQNNGGLSYEDIISGQKVPAGNANQSGRQPSSGEMSLNDASALNSIPKATPVVAPVQNKQDNTTAPHPSLSGQYDVKAGGGAELVTPEYNGKQDVSITYQKDKVQGTPAAGTPAVGNSSNNSSPVLITPKEDAADKNAVVSAETEALLKEFRDGKAFANVDESNISIELGTDEDVNNLEKLWNDISKNYSAAIGKYQPFYSVDTPADGQGKEVFHLRVGPVKSLDEGDNICSQLGRNGIFCSVVRIQ